jgi:ADP-dependent phosphofructokinase/glucokinase
VALGADNFVGKAHHLLFGLYLDRAELADAEFHLDQVAATDIAVLYGYQDLAASYLDQERNADAVRVAAKDLQVKYPWVRPLCERLTALASDTAKAVWVW